MCSHLLALGIIIHQNSAIGYCRLVTNEAAAATDQSGKSSLGVDYGSRLARSRSGNRLLALVCCSKQLSVAKLIERPFGENGVDF